MKRLLLALVVLLALSLPLAAEAPLSLEEARGYVAKNPEAAAQDIMALDALERTVPEITMPAPVFIFTAGEVGLSWASPMTITIGSYLEYAVALPTSRAPRPPPKVGPYVVVSVVSALLGAIIAGLVQ